MKEFSTKNLIFLVSAIILVIASLLIVFLSPKDGSEREAEIVLGKKAYPIEIADTEVQRVKGLSGREEIGSKGLLFVFPESGEYGFWMKEMNFNIDILWLDEQFQIVHIEQDVAKDSFPKIFEPDAPAKYVFEADAGFATDNNIRVGEKLEFRF